jgi:hypothetical protein
VSGHDLGVEFAVAVDQLHRPGNLDYALNLGIPRCALFGSRPVLGMAGIEELDRDFYQPCLDGEQSLIIADFGETADELVGQTVNELVAYSAKDGRWRVRRGDVPILGLNNAMIDYAATLKEPIDLFETPLSWLQHEGRGLCIIDWNLRPLDHLQGLRIRCETTKLERRLKARIAEAALESVTLVKACIDEG